AITDLNQAIAIAEARGPAAGLERVDALADSGALSRCHLLPSVRGELLARLGEVGEAREVLLRATKLTTNDRERDVLEDKARQLRCPMRWTASPTGRIRPLVLCTEDAVD